jgi:hypothetical protein
MSEAYFATKENVLEKLEKYGVAIIPSVLNDVECKEMEKNMWEITKTGKKTEKVLFPGMMEMNIQENF